MKNCNCKDKEVTPCNDKCVVRLMIDECSGNKINYITLASAVLMGCNDTETVEDVLNEIQGKLSKIDNHIDEYTWDAIIAFLKNNLTRLEPELTNLINSRIENYFLHNDFAGLKQLFRQLFAEWEITFTNLINRIGQGISREELNLILSEYAKKTEIPNLDAYLTKSEAQTLYLPKGNYLTEHLDLSEYAKKSDIPEGQDLSAYVKTIKVNGNSFNPTNGITDLGNLTDNVRMQYEELLSRNTDSEIVFPMGAQTKSIKFYQDENELPEDDDNLQIYAKFTYGYEYGVTKNNIYEITDVKDVDLLSTMARIYGDIPCDGNTFTNSTLYSKYLNDDFSDFAIEVQNDSYLMYSKSDRELMEPEYRSDGTTIAYYTFPFTITKDILEKIWNLAKKYSTHVTTKGYFDFMVISNGALKEMNLGHGIQLINIHTFDSKEQNPKIIALRNNSIYYDETHGCFFKYIEKYNYAKFISQTVTVDENSSFDDLNFLYQILGMSINIICKDAQENASRTRIVIPLTYFTGALIQGSVLTDLSKRNDLNPVVYTASFSKNDDGDTVYTLNLMKLYGERCTPDGGQLRCITTVPSSGNDEP